MAKSRIKFDVDKLRNMQTTCKNAENALDNLKGKLDTSLSKLREGWNTPAGDHFFANLEDDWTTQVNHYKKIVGAIVDLLETAVSEYGKIEERANELHVK